MFFAKIPSHTRQNAITEGDLECILTRNCEGTEQLHLYKERIFCANIQKCVSEYFRQRILSFYFLRREQKKQKFLKYPLTNKRGSAIFKP